MTKHAEGALHDWRLNDCRGVERTLGVVRRSQEFDFGLAERREIVRVWLRSITMGGTTYSRGDQLTVELGDPLRFHAKRGTVYTSHYPEPVKEGYVCRIKERTRGIKGRAKRVLRNTVSAIFLG